MPYLAVAFLTLLPLGSGAGAGARGLHARDNPFVGRRPRPEVYALGMRNPYRWSFDRQTGDLYVGDVGGTNEEITFIPAPQGPGANLGWNCFSGTAVQSGCTPSSYFPPAYEYPSSAGRGDRRLRGARPRAAVVRSASTCSAASTPGSS